MYSLTKFWVNRLPTWKCPPWGKAKRNKYKPALFLQCVPLPCWLNAHSDCALCYCVLFELFSFMGLRSKTTAGVKTKET